MVAKRGRHSHTRRASSAARRRRQHASRPLQRQASSDSVAAGEGTASGSNRSSGKRKVVRVHLGRAYTMGEWFRMAMDDLGRAFRETRKPKSAHIFVFSNTRDAEEFLPSLKSGQVINRFPFMDRMAHKRALGTALVRMQRVFPDEYNFFPATYCLPADMPELCRDFDKKKTYIYKPDGGCQGDGIFLLKDPSDLAKRTRSNAVVQEYIARPLLMNRLKFDFRVYVLVTSLQPLKVYLCREGLARFCTEPYKRPTTRNLHKVYMHLTNYSLNKHNAKKYVHADYESSDGSDTESYTSSEDPKPPPAPKPAKSAFVGQATSAVLDDHASKRTLSAVLRTLQSQGADVNSVWRHIQGLCARTVIALQDQLQHHLYQCLGKRRARHVDKSPCFHILGLDVMLDNKMRPWLIEVNNNPSLRMDHEKEIRPGEYISEYSPVDEAVKRPAVAGALHIVAHSDPAGTLYDRIVPHVDAPFNYFDRFTGAQDGESPGDASATPVAQQGPAPASIVASAGAGGGAGEPGVPETRVEPRTTPAGGDTAEPCDTMPPSAGLPGPHLLDENKLMVFERTRTIFQIVGRGDNLSSSQFCRYIRRCRLMPPRCTTADLDLLFIRATKRRDSDTHRSPMGVTQFSDALMDLGAMLYPDASVSERLSMVLDTFEEGIDSMLEKQLASANSGGGAPSMMRR